MPKINAAGLELLKSFEQCRLEAYDDGRGRLTVGFGHTGPDVFEDQVITGAYAEELLERDLARFEQAVSDALEVDVTDNQFAALVCFAFNVGTIAFRTSTLLRKVNDEDFEGAAKEFGRWNKVNGQVWAGLTARREAERLLFTSEG